MRTRRLLTRVVAAAFLLMAMQQLVAAPAVRASVRTEQRIARSSTAQKLRESVPAPRLADLPELPEQQPRLLALEPPQPTSKAFALRRFQRPPPSL